MLGLVTGYRARLREIVECASAVRIQHSGASDSATVKRRHAAADRSLSSSFSIGDVQMSPDGSRIAYAVVSSDQPGRPYTQVWVMNTASRETHRLGAVSGSASSPRWSPDGLAIAYVGRDGQHAGLMVANVDGAEPRFVAPMQGTNHPLPTSGDQITWSPDGKQIAFVSASAGPEHDANGDPMVITRYLYKPTASEGLTHFNDNKRLHIFVVDLASGSVTGLTTGNYYEHSIEWSPAGDRIVFVSNHETDPDRFFNYDIFTVDVSTKRVAQLTQTKNAEYRPTWSPDGKEVAYLGTTRPLTSSETTMENTHVWLMNADGSNRHEVRESLDNRQGAPRWSSDGRALLFTVEERGDVHLYRMPAAGGTAERVLADEGSVGAWSIASAKAPQMLAFALAAAKRPSELFYSTAGGASTQATNVNDPILRHKRIATIDRLDFASFDGTPIEAFLTEPLEHGASAKAPMIVMMHGGPHGQQGPEFNAKAQLYAAHGFASLMVNYRGSTGYGQKLTDAIFNDQNGGEAKDVVAGVDAALKQYPLARWQPAGH